MNDSVNNNVSANGSCLCGSISISTDSLCPDASACHCDMCRQWSSGPFMVLECDSDLVIKGEEHISIYKSSDWAERAFCRKCGSNLYYKLSASGQHFVSAGLFDQSATLVFDHEVFIDEKPDYYSFSQDTRKLTGKELFDQFTNQS